MSQPPLPLMCSPLSDAPFVRRNAAAVSSARFMGEAQAVARSLPQGKYAINLCEDRYHFLLVFVAMLLRGQVNLLPANRSPGEVQSVSSRYGECPCIVDQAHPGLGPEQHVVEAASLTPEPPLPEVPSLEPERICAVVFTSGSTGESQPWEKRWGELYHGALLTRRMLTLNDPAMTVVATVPPQHMYGLETTVLLPLVTGMPVYSGKTFFPHDLQDALQSVPSPRLLITTPVHLNACIESGMDWPAVSQIISATAPLSTELAKRAEENFGCPLYEIYGSTETGAIATRRTRMQQLWRLHEGLQMRPAGEEPECVTVQGGHLRQAVELNDRVRIMESGRFTLLGRNSDMLKIAGKRVSLGDLNHKLLAIPGVEDGVFVDAQEEGQAVTRLCALVAAPGLTSKQILDALKDQLDPLCLPRPIYRVERLPRNEAGKLPRKAVLELLAQLRKK
ncbi:MAG: AMP-binding protein [Pseudomonadota bacterium]